MSLSQKYERKHAQMCDMERGERREVYDVEMCAVYTEVYRGVGFFHTCRAMYDVERSKVYEGREVYERRKV